MEQLLQNFSITRFIGMLVNVQSVPVSYSLVGAVLRKICRVAIRFVGSSVDCLYFVFD